MEVWKSVKRNNYLKTPEVKMVEVILTWDEACKIANSEKTGAQTIEDTNYPLDRLIVELYKIVHG